MPLAMESFASTAQIIVASSIPLASLLDQIRSRGLFVYDSDAALATVDAWQHG